ncbi:MAG: condensation domain-containing protein [Acidobacteriota bacterium]
MNDALVNSNIPLSPEKKRALLAQLLREKADKSRPLPLSFAEKRMWLLHQLDRDSSAYNSQMLVRFTGQLDITVLEKSLNEVIRRQEILRTIFPTTDGQPFRFICSTTDTNQLPIADLQTISELEREGEAQRLISDNVNQPFDLNRGPILRSLIIRLDTQQYLLLLMMHHIIVDVWSFNILMQELVALYKAFSDGQQSPLPALSLQYADFAEWQQQRFQREALQPQLQYWKNKLAGSPLLLELPTDRPRPTFQSFNGSRHAKILPAAIAKSLNTLSRDREITPFIIMLTALKILFFKWTEQHDIVVGTVVADRSLAETEKLMGCFLNFLPLRSILSSDQTGSELLQQVKKTVLEAYAHQSCPFEKIVEAINPSRRLNLNPIYNVGFLMHNFHFSLDIHLNDKLEAYMMPLDIQASVLDLRFIAIPKDLYEEMVIECEYNVDLFDADTITDLANCYQEILKILVESPETKLSSFELSKNIKTRAEISKVSVQTQQNSMQPTPKIEPTYLTNRIEQIIMNIFIEVLGYSNIGINDNFFALGGDSFQAAQIIAKLENTFQVELSSRSLIKSPTVAGLAIRIQQKQSSHIVSTT